jgi:hypothetical protein
LDNAQLLYLGDEFALPKHRLLNNRPGSTSQSSLFYFVSRRAAVFTAMDMETRGNKPGLVNRMGETTLLKKGY